MKRKILIFSLFFISFVLFILGITQPFMTFKISLSSIMGGGGGLFGNLLGAATSKMDQTMSYNILDAISNLIKNDQYFVAVLISFFGILIPIVKSVLFIVVNVTNKKSRAWNNFLGILGKFAMADVFCVGIFIAFLYSKFQDKVLNVSLENGYYYFVFYCLLSIVISIIATQESKKSQK